MTEFYKTPKGRVVVANAELRKLVSTQSGKFGSYAPCDEEGNVTAFKEAAISFTAEDMAAEKQRGVNQGWEEARKELGPVLEKAKADAVAEAESAAKEVIEAAKAEAFEAGKNAGLEEAKTKSSGKKKGQ